MLTAYDYPTAMAMDRAGIDSILVGDSLAMVVFGYENTLPVTMEEMLHHARAVARGAKSALLVGDMPFMSYQVSAEEDYYFRVDSENNCWKESNLAKIMGAASPTSIPVANSLLGTAVASDGDWVASVSNGEGGTGFIYIFRKVSGNWTFFQ